MYVHVTREVRFTVVSRTHIVSCLTGLAESDVDGFETKEGKVSGSTGSMQSYIHILTYHRLFIYFYFLKSV